MWIPKTEEEIKELAKEKEKSARKIGILGALLFIIMQILFAKYIGVKAGKVAPIGPTYTWDQIFQSFPRLCVYGVLAGTLFYFIFRKFKDITSLICDSCSKIKRNDKIKDCDCGGHFVFLEEMKWIEDVETENDSEETKENT